MTAQPPDRSPLKVRPRTRRGRVSPWERAIRRGGSGDRRCSRCGFSCVAILRCRVARVRRHRASRRGTDRPRSHDLRIAFTYAGLVAWPLASRRSPGRLPEDRPGRRRVRLCWVPSRTWPRFRTTSAKGMLHRASRTSKTCTRRLAQHDHGLPLTIDGPMPFKAKGAGREGQRGVSRASRPSSLSPVGAKAAEPGGRRYQRLEGARR